MLDVNIKTTNYNILASGSIIVPNNETLNISFEGLNFCFVFIKEQLEEKKGRYDVRIIKNDKQEDVLEITLHDMNTSFFGTPNKMLQVGHYQGLNLYLQFSIVGLKDQDEYAQQLLFYTFYQDKTKKD